jgi:ComF family protein
VINSIIDFFYPRICPGCTTALLKGEISICTNCLYQLPRTHFWKDSENPVSQIFWGRVYVENAASFLYFQKGSKLQEIIHYLKYRKQDQIGIVLGQLFGLELARTAFVNAQVIVPVPIHKSRLRKRGYNQSEKIGIGLSNALGIPIENSALVRLQSNESQTHKARFNRWENVEHIFSITNPSAIAGKHVLLVDDVLTTGATLESCASEILKVPNTKVSIATLAYAMK